MMVIVKEIREKGIPSQGSLWKVDTTGGVGDAMTIRRRGKRGDGRMQNNNDVLLPLMTEGQVRRDSFAGP